MNEIIYYFVQLRKRYYMFQGYISFFTLSVDYILAINYYLSLWEKHVSTIAITKNYS